MPSSGSKQNDPPAKSVPKYVPDSSELHEAQRTRLASTSQEEAQSNAQGEDDERGRQVRAWVLIRLM
jgi:hypothetical protein